MDEILKWFTIERIMLTYLLFIKITTTIRDVIDKTPATDDNWFERMCTIISKLPQSLLLGQRPK